MVKRHIILCIFTIIVIIPTIIYLIVFGFGGQCSEHQDSKYLPSKQGIALWTTADGDSWFKVTEIDESYCAGEITFNGKTQKCHYNFEGADWVSVLLNYGEFFSVDNVDVNDIIGYDGKCEFYKNKVCIELDIGEEKTVFLEFMKQDNV